MKDFLIDKKTGLGHFPKLQNEFGVLNYVTYDNKIWGNLNPKFTKNEKEIKQIESKDRQLADLLGCKFIGAITTPPEPTIIDLDKKTYQYLDFANKPDKKGYKFVLVHANTIVLTVPKIELVFAPRDCPVLIFVQNGWDGIICMHLGAPQIVQDLHNKTLLFFQALYPEVDISKFEVFITPYISSKNYKISKEKYKLYGDVFPKAKKFLYQRDNGQNEQKDYTFDFAELIKKDLKEEWGITQIFESEICTYESAKKGNLFSRTLTKENEKKFLLGAFNVVISIKK